MAISNRCSWKKITGCLALCFLLFSASAPAEEELKLEDIAKTEAAKLYISKQFKESLEAFKQLETAHPQNVIIKRYIASLHDTLRQFPEARQKLIEALAIQENDLMARQMLGDIYIKEADFENAKKQFQRLRELDKDGANGKYAEQKLKTLGEIESSSSSPRGKRMPVEAFMKSGPAQLFARGKYEEALAGLGRLLETYPEDVLIRRFKGITLTRLGKVDEAILVFQEALALDETNAALHFYLGQAWSQKEKFEEARKEYRWVLDHDESSYKLRAQQAMFATLSKAAAAPQKPWTLSLSQAYDFDTNATFKSSDTTIATAGDQNSGKYSTTLISTYRLFQNKRWTVTADGLYAQSIYNDFPNLNTYTPGLGISALYGLSVFNKPAFINVREGQTVTYLKNKLYVWSNSLSPSFIYVPFRPYKVTFTYRWTYNEYENNGATPDTTSRDGFGSTYAILNTYYFNNARTFYTTHGYDFEHSDTEGVNYIKKSQVGRLGLHFPIVWKVEGDLSYVFKDSNYPKYAAARPKRRDDVHTFTATLSAPLGRYFTLNTIYTFEDSRAKNNLYEYTRNDFGVKVTLKL